MLKSILHIRQRREILLHTFDVQRDFARLAESCIPSYANPNILIASGFWWRLFAASRLAGELTTGSPVLDFGAAVGELAHLLPSEVEYQFMEIDPWLANTLQTLVPRATSTSLEQAVPGSFQTIFALDSLEHNHHPDRLLARLAQLLAPGGSLILSGPTENFLYRLGRRLAGYPDHYHHFTIDQLEQLANRYFACQTTLTGPLWLPLFRISKWQKRMSASG
ncbi:MAG: class I SAM-dependent methyltransferase [Magnetococcales bacterium]|nr:methyltransferase domain-containing protein [Magnetococcales bacterium]NGZ05932.1 class I SAM-dependent methyltransferase [Magnetococcales bacterium]